MMWEQQKYIRAFYDKTIQEIAEKDDDNTFTLSEIDFFLMARDKFAFLGLLEVKRYVRVVYIENSINDAFDADSGIKTALLRILHND